MVLWRHRTQERWELTYLLEYLFIYISYQATVPAKENYYVTNKYNFYLTWDLWTLVGFKLNLIHDPFEFTRSNFLSSKSIPKSTDGLENQNTKNLWRKQLNKIGK